MISWYRPRPSGTHTFRCEMYAVTARCGDSLILINATVTQVSWFFPPDKSASSCASRITNSRSSALSVTHIMKFGNFVSEVDLSIFGGVWSECSPLFFPAVLMWERSARATSRLANLFIGAGGPRTTNAAARPHEHEYECFRWSRCDGGPTES